MNAPFPLRRPCLPLAAVLALATLVVAAPESEKSLPTDETASPSVTQAKLAESKRILESVVKNQAASANNLKRIGIAFHKHVDDNSGLLPTDIVSKGGKQLLSWRVRLLPQLGEKELFDKFKLDEPWNSKHNLALLEKMPKVYASPRITLKHKGYTVYQVFSGPGALFGAGQMPRFPASITDGTSNTIGVVEASKAVPWTKPADLPFDKDKDLPDFGKAFDNKPLVLMMDGEVGMLDLKKISATTLKSAITPAGGEVLGSDWDLTTGPRKPLTPNQKLDRILEKLEELDQRLRNLEGKPKE